MLGAMLAIYCLRVIGEAHSISLLLHVQVFSGHTGAVRCGGFTPDGKAVVTGGGEGDATLKVWDPKSGNCTGTVQGYGFHEAGEPVVCTLFISSVRQGTGGQRGE